MFLQPHDHTGIYSSENFPGHSRLLDQGRRLEGGSWILLQLCLQDEESNRSLSVGLSHGQDLHLLLLHGRRLAATNSRIQCIHFPAHITSS